VTHFYRAYGIKLASDIPLPGLRPEAPIPQHVDLELTTGLEPSWAREASGLPSRPVHPRSPSSEDQERVNVTCLGVGDFYQLDYGDGTRFLLNDPGKCLWGVWKPPLTAEDFATYFCGPVLGFILRHRGITALHASAVRIEGQAVLLCGESESGKSTTSAALALRKFSVLTEDVSAIKEEQGTFYVEPGYPRICLWPDAVEKLVGAPEALPRLTPTWEKRFLPLDNEFGTFEPQRQRLGVIYILSPRTAGVEAPYIEPLSLRDALLLLVQNTYMNWVLNGAQRASELDLLAKIVQTVPVRRIFPHVNPARLAALCDLIAEDATRLFTATEPAARISHG
jgi:hypothetical protein